MFSDLPNRPRMQLVMRRPPPAPSYEDLNKIANNNKPEMVFSRSFDVNGADRYKFFKMPVVDLNLDVPPVLDLHLNSPQKSIRTTASTKRYKKFNKNCMVQTQYRESSVQTSPWQPDHIVKDGSKPEMLKLDFLKWGSGLPAGMQQVTLIHRARMKREWEKAMPPITDKNSLEERRNVIEAMETDEWAFREQEIQDIQNLRLELLEEMLNELHEKSKCRSEQKIKMFCEVKQAEKEEKLAKLRHKTEREMRKLDMKHRGVRLDYHSVNIIDEHIDHSSELYGPQIRHGQHPKRCHQVIDENLKTYNSQFRGVEDISTLPRWLNEATKIKDCCCIKLPGTRLCIRETKWTTPILKQLHEELKDLRKVTKRKCTLRTRICHKVDDVETPEVDGINDMDEDNYQAAILIESVLRGRASQMLIYEGRDRCRELIQELRSTHALQTNTIIERYQERVEVKSQQRLENATVRNAKLLQEALSHLQGTVVGSLLDFLNKELRRLLDERKAHAVCLLVERERVNREAAEAGRRQKELLRREEHDEMFKQIVKVHQDTVDMYLQDIITEGMEFASSDEAHKYITKLAVKIDNEAYDTVLKQPSFSQEEEMVADLVHHFILPEVEKSLVRERVKQRQKRHLKAVHENIYSKIEKLRKPGPPPPKDIAKKMKKQYIEDDESNKEDKELSFRDTSSTSSTLSDQYPAPQYVNYSSTSFSDVYDNQNLNLIYGGRGAGIPTDTVSCQLSVMAPLLQDKDKPYAFSQQSIVSKYLQKATPATTELPNLEKQSDRSLGPVADDETNKQTIKEDDPKKEEGDVQLSTDDYRDRETQETDIQLNTINDSDPKRPETDYENADQSISESGNEKSKRKAQHVHITSSTDLTDTE